MLYPERHWLLRDLCDSTGRLVLCSRAKGPQTYQDDIAVASQLTFQARDLQGSVGFAEMSVMVVLHAGLRHTFVTLTTRTNPPKIASPVFPLRRGHWPLSNDDREDDFPLPHCGIARRWWHGSSLQSGRHGAWPLRRLEVSA